MQTEKNRIHTIDQLRGVAACSVCIFHFTNGNPTLLSDENWLKYVGSFGWIGVHIFFVISGYIIPYSMAQSQYKLTFFPKFLLKRFIRVEIPYVTSIFLGLFSAYWVALYREEIYEVDGWKVLAHLFYLTVFWGYDWFSPIYWTLAIEFQFYILIGVGYPLFFSSTIWRYLFLLMLNALSFVWLESHWLWYYLPSFSLGICLYQFQKKIISVEWLFLFGIALEWMIWQRFGVVCAFFVMCTVVVIGTKKNILFNSKLGIISYALYLTHIPIGGRLIGVMAWQIQTEWMRMIGIGIVLCCSIGAAYIFYKWVEKPSIKISQKIRYST